MSARCLAAGSAKRVISGTSNIFMVASNPPTLIVGREMSGRASVASIVPMIATSDVRDCPVLFVRTLKKIARQKSGRAFLALMGICVPLARAEAPGSHDSAVIATVRNLLRDDARLAEIGRAHV